MRRISILIVVLAVLSASVVWADEVVFTNGDRLTGKVETVQGGKLTMVTTVAGKVVVDVAAIRTFRTDAPIKLFLKDGTMLFDRAGVARTGRIALGERTVALADIGAVNPPPKPKAKWTGSASAGYSMTSGNSHTQAASVGVNMSRRGERDRISFDGGWIFAEQRDDTTKDDETTTEKWWAGGKYDYFFSKKFYVFTNARVEQDRVADILWRVLAGAGPGYQWVENDVVKFSTDAGLAYLYDKFEREGADSSLGAQAGYHFELAAHDKARLIHDFRYYPSLEEQSDFFITTTAELRMELTKRFFASSKVRIDHDSTPAAGSEKTDFTYLLSLGVNLF